MTGLRIAYMGTPEYALGPLSRLHDSDHDIVCVYTRAPKPKGRGHSVQNSPVHQWAEEHGIEVRHPKSLKTEDVQADFKALELDAAIVVAYGLLLPKAILEAPRYGCINLHPSLLPRWRGAAPVQRTILAGDTKAGMTIMQLDEGMDSGPIIAQEAIDLAPGTTALDLHNKLFALGEDMLIRVLDDIAKTGELELTPQDESLVTFADKLEKPEGLVSFTDSAQNIARKIRGLYPWPGVWVETGGKRLKLIDVSFSFNSSGAAPGQILSKDLDVACGGGTALTLKRVQPEGKPPMDGASWLNGARLKPGDLLK